jgi:hypothetical protein
LKRRQNDADPRRGQRVHEGHVQTAVNTYAHPGSRTVTPIGLAHMAEPDCFQQVRRRVDEAEAWGAMVLYERTNWDVDSEARTEEELAGPRAFRDSIFDRYKPFHMLNLCWPRKRPFRARRFHTCVRT